MFVINSTEFYEILHSLETWCYRGNGKQRNLNKGKQTIIKHRQTMTQLNKTEKNNLDGLTYIQNNLVHFRFCNQYLVV